MLARFWGKIVKHSWYETLTNHGKEIRVIVRFLLRAIQSLLRIKRPRQSQSKICPKSVDNNRASSVRVLQEFDSDQLVDGVEHDLQNTDDQQLQAAHFSQDSSVGD